MLPAPLLPRSPEPFIVELGEISGDNCKQAYTSHLALFDSGSVVFKRKCVPSEVAADNPKLLIYGVNDVRVAVVFRWPTENHGKTLYSNQRQREQAG